MTHDSSISVQVIHESWDILLPSNRAFRQNDRTKAYNAIHLIIKALREVCATKGLLLNRGVCESNRQPSKAGGSFVSLA